MLTTGGEMQANKQIKKEAVWVGFFCALGRKEALPPLSWQGQNPQTSLISTRDVDGRWLIYMHCGISLSPGREDGHPELLCGG